MSSPDPLPLSNRHANLRRLTATDLTVFYEYRGDERLARFQGWSPMSKEAALKFIEEMEAAPLFQPGNWNQLGIADPDTDKLLGDVGLYVSGDGSTAEVGFTIANEAQGRGVATAAVEAALTLIFSHTSVKKVLGITDIRNSASIRLLSRVGMRQVEQREAVFKGEACIELVFCLERDG
jgi:RimJ/RimL family protein N-acetyltransferase